MLDLKSRMALWQIVFVLAGVVAMLFAVRSNTFATVAKSTITIDQATGETVIYPEEAYKAVIKQHAWPYKITQTYAAIGKYNILIFACRLANKGWDPELTYQVAHAREGCIWMLALCLFAAVHLLRCKSEVEERYRQNGLRKGETRENYLPFRMCHFVAMIIFALAAYVLIRSGLGAIGLALLIGVMVLLERNRRRVKGEAYLEQRKAQSRRKLNKWQEQHRRRGEQPANLFGKLLAHFGMW